MRVTKLNSIKPSSCNAWIKFTFIHFFFFLQLSANSVVEVVDNSCSILAVIWSRRRQQQNKSKHAVCPEMIKSELINENVSQAESFSQSSKWWKPNMVFTVTVLKANVWRESSVLQFQELDVIVGCSLEIPEQHLCMQRGKSCDEQWPKHVWTFEILNKFPLFLPPPGERLFPPPSGLSYSTWFCVERFSAAPQAHPVRLLTVVRRATSSEQHYVCLAVVLSTKDRSLTVSTKEELLQTYCEYRREYYYLFLFVASGGVFYIKWAKKKWIYKEAQFIYIMCLKWTFTHNSEP